MINFVMITLSNAIHVSMLSVAADFAASNGGSPMHFLTLAKMHYDAYYWVHFLMLMLYSVGGGVLYFFLFRTHLVPKWLAVWGLLASLVVFLGGALQLGEISVSILFFVQNGIFVLTFVVYLLIFGFLKNSLIAETA